jgi:uncharacterized membrane protein
MIKKLVIGLLLTFCFAFPSSAYDFVEKSGLNASAQEAGYELNLEQREIIIANAINIVLSLIGVLFIGLMIYGGYNWMTAGGNEEKVKTAKGTVTEAAIGLIVVIGAYAISYFVLEFLVNLTLDS